MSARHKPAEPGSVPVRVKRHSECDAFIKTVEDSEEDQRRWGLFVNLFIYMLVFFLYAVRKNILLLRSRQALWFEETGQCAGETPRTSAGGCGFFPRTAGEEASFMWTWKHSSRIDEKLLGHSAANRLSHGAPSCQFSSTSCYFWRTRLRLYTQWYV